MKVVQKKLADLKPPERNVRMHSDKQVKEFIRSLEAFGQIRPIVVDEQNTILAGNGLYAALVAKGETSADCYVMTGLSENEKKKLMLADNKIFSLGVDDIDVFEDFLKELGDDLEIPGYDTELLETLTADLGSVDDMLSGYGTVTESKKEQIANTARQYQEQEETNAHSAEEIKPAAPPPPDTVGPEQQLERKFIQCPQCGKRIWL